MILTEKLLLILIYQLGDRRTPHGRRICSICDMVGAHVENCKIGEMEQWVQRELMRLWKEEK